MRIWGDLERVEDGETGGEGNWLQREAVQSVDRAAKKEESGDSCGFLVSSLEIKIS